MEPSEVTKPFHLHPEEIEIKSLTYNKPLQLLTQEEAEVDVHKFMAQLSNSMAVLESMAQEKSDLMRRMKQTNMNILRHKVALTQIMNKNRFETLSNGDLALIYKTNKTPVMVDNKIEFKVVEEPNEETGGGKKAKKEVMRVSSQLFRKFVEAYCGNGSASADEMDEVMKSVWRTDKNEKLAKKNETTKKRIREDDTGDGVEYVDPSEIVCVFSCVKGNKKLKIVS